MPPKKRFSESSIIKDTKESKPLSTEEKLAKPKPEWNNSRKGKKGVITYTTPENKRTLQLIALEQDKTQDQLLHEALELLFNKYGKS